MGFFDRVGRFIDDVLLLPDDIRADLEAAEDLLEAGKADAAEAQLLEILKTRPTLPRAWVDLARARENLGDVRGACEAIEEALTLSPDDGDLALVAARLALHVGSADSAIDHARVAARAFASETGPPLAEACAILARAERRRGRPDRAVRELRKALAIMEEDVDLRVELVECLCETSRIAMARGVLSNLPGEVSIEQANRLGMTLYGAGALDLARPFLERAATARNGAAHSALAEIHRRQGDHVGAEHYARSAVALSGGAHALATLGRILFDAGRFRDAAEALLAASADKDLALLREAARCVPLEDAATLSRLADRIVAIDEAEPLGVACRAWAGLATNDPRAAAALTDEHSSEPRALLARAEELARRDEHAGVLTLLDRPMSHFSFAADRERAAELRRTSMRKLWIRSNGRVDLAAAIDAVERFGKERLLPAVERPARALRDEMDRPLLLAVLGEFNAGKSTLINAFIGAEVAPMGITPTTASLNVLRDGAKRRVRIVRADGTTQEGPYEDLRELLQQGERERVDRVEILMPHETLEKVWILDTPGTNALDPEHERLAREAIRRADAVLWVLDSGQAAKLTESKIYFQIRDSGRLVLPVLNKRDRLQPHDLERVRAQVTTAMRLSEPPIALSARQALKCIVAGDSDGFARSGFGDLLQFLEERVFSRAPELKHRAISARLRSVLDEALGTEVESTARDRRDLEVLKDLGDRLEAATAHAMRAADAAMRWLDASLTKAFREAAEEVLAFVRPRRNRFASHGVDAEDRRFLFEVLDQKTVAATEACEERLIRDLRETFREMAEPLALDDGDLDSRLKARVAPALNGFSGFQRGFVAGGSLARFFERVLPQSELELSSVVSGLLAARADLRSELRSALEDALGAFIDDLAGLRQARTAQLTVRLHEISRNIYEPLQTLRDVLMSMQDAASVAEMSAETGSS